MVHLILPRPGEERRVHEQICAWRRDGVLVLDDEPAYYWLEEQYIAPDGTERTRGGFIGLVHIEPYEQHIVLRHERVREEPVAGRLELLRATRAHLSPIFGVYHDPRAPRRAGAARRAATRSRCSTSPATTARGTACGAAGPAMPRWRPRWPPRPC